MNESQLNCSILLRRILLAGYIRIVMTEALEKLVLLKLQECTVDHLDFVILENRIEQEIRDDWLWYHVKHTSVKNSTI